MINYACTHVRCDIDQFCCSSSIVAFEPINTKQRPLQKPQALLFIIHEFSRSRMPLNFSHGDSCDDKISARTHGAS